MKQFVINAQDCESASQFTSIRWSELNEQHWSRKKSENLTISEGVNLNDESRAVILYLRSYDLRHGLPRVARRTATALNKHFTLQRGNKYLRRFFAGGSVTQGCRLANLRAPADATDTSFGASY